MHTCPHCHAEFDVDHLADGYAFQCGGCGAMQTIVRPAAPAGAARARAVTVQPEPAGARPRAQVVRPEPPRPAAPAAAAPPAAGEVSTDEPRAARPVTARSTPGTRARRAAVPGRAGAEDSGARRHRGKPAWLPAVVVIGMVAVLGVGYAIHRARADEQSAAAGQARRQEIAAHEAALRAAMAAENAKALAKELPWFRGRPERAPADAGLLPAAEALLLRLESARLEADHTGGLRSQRDELLAQAATEEGRGNREDAVKKLEQVIALYREHAGSFPDESLDVAIRELMKRVLDNDENHAAARAFFGDERVAIPRNEMNHDRFGKLEPFVADDVSELARLLDDGQWFSRDEAAGARARAQRHLDALHAVERRHQGDPRFAKALERVAEVRFAGDLHLADQLSAYFDDGMLVIQKRGLGRAAEEFFAVLNLEALRFARQHFAATCQRLGLELTDNGEPLVMVALESEQAYREHTMKLLHFEPHGVRAYYIPKRRYIVTYVMPPNWESQLAAIVDDVVTTSVHEGMHHVLDQQRDGEHTPDPSYWVSEGYAEYAAGIDIAFDPTRGAGTCKITHTGCNRTRLRNYLQVLKGARLPLRTLVEHMHRPKHLAELADDMAKDSIPKAGETAAEFNQRRNGLHMMLIGLVYAQGHSFMHYCYQGSGGKLASAMDRWLAWQWSAGCAKAKREEVAQTFNLYFQDWVKIDAAWRAWEDSLDPQTLK